MGRVNDTFLMRRSAQIVQEEGLEMAKQAFKAVAEAGAPECPSCKRTVKHRLGVEWCQDRQMSEKSLQERVIRRAKLRGWKVAHAGRAWVGDVESGNGQMITPMAKGWPDLTLAKAGHKLIFMELKRQDGELEDEQVEWLRLLNECGAVAVLVRPIDLREGRVNWVLDHGSPI